MCIYRRYYNVHNRPLEPVTLTNEHRLPLVKLHLQAILDKFGGFSVFFFFFVQWKTFFERQKCYCYVNHIKITCYDKEVGHFFFMVSKNHFALNSLSNDTILDGFISCFICVVIDHKIKAFYSTFSILIDFVNFFHIKYE